MNYYVYIIKCHDNYLYTGITSNLKKRLNEHSKGLSKLTKNRLPITLQYSEKHDTRIAAAKKEKEIKGWSRKKKDLLIERSKPNEEWFTPNEEKFTPNEERRP